MSKIRIALVTLALGASVAFTTSAFAEKMKATLDAKSENPPTKSDGKGEADINYDSATKKLTWKLTYSGLTGPATAAHFTGQPRSARTPPSPLRSRTQLPARLKAAPR